MDPRYNLVTSVQTWVPRATDVANSILFGAFSTVNETGPGPQDPPSDDDGLDKWETIALGVASAFAVTALGYLLYAVIAHFCASGKKSKKDKDFVERAGESAKDRAKRYKHWAEDRAEEGQGVFHDVEDWFEHAGEDIKEAAEEVKDKVKELFTGKDKKGDKSKSKSKDDESSPLLKAKDAAKDAKKKVHKKGKGCKEAIKGNDGVDDEESADDELA